MADRRRPLRLTYRVFLSLLLAAIPLFAASAYLALGVGQAQLRDGFGDQLGEVAERTAATIDSYVFRASLDVGILAKVPVLENAARDASATAYDVEVARQIDRLWQSGVVPPPALGSFFDSPASRFLRDVANDPIYREIMLTDRHGRLVAASGATSDYVQSDETWWVNAFGDGVGGRVEVSDVEWDESAGVFAVSIAVPVLNPERDAVVGILRVLSDSREMFATIRGPGNIDAQLIRRDGSVVFGEGAPTPSERFFAEPLLREQLANADPAAEPFRLWFTAAGSDGASRLVAVAACQVGTSYSNLQWLVAISERESQLFAPVASQARNLLYALATTAIVVLGLALWFSLRLTIPAETEEMAMHLVEHSQVPHLDDED